MANATSIQLQELYVAYFGRAADPSGLDYWTAKGISTADFAAHMHDQPEFKSVYGTKSIEEQVNQIYKNLFDREADVTGLNYWTLQINLGTLKLAEIANDLIFAAQNNSGSEDDKTALANRGAAASAYTAKVKESTASILAFQPLNDGKAEGSTFSAGSNITEAISYLSGIDKDTAYTQAGVDSSVAIITANGAPSVSVGAKTFTLTTSTDSGADFTGTTAGDTFVGAYVADSGTGTTFTTGDTLDGGAGTDSLSLSVSGLSTVANTLAAQTLTSIETIKILNFDSNADDDEDTTIDAALWTGVTTVNLDNSSATGDTAVNNLAAIAAVGVSNGSGDLTIDYAAAAVSGTADEQTLNLSGVQAGTITFDSGIETVNVVSSTGNSTVTEIISTGAETLNISGSKDLTLSTALDTNFKTVDASALTGDLTTIATGAVDLTYSGGSGDDKIRLAGGNITASDTVTGGDGTDTVVLTAATSSTTAAAKVTGFETVKSYQDVAAANTLTINTAQIVGTSSSVGVEKMTYTEPSNDIDQSVTVTAAFTNLDDPAVSISGVTSAGDASDTGTMTAVVTLAEATDTSADTTTITLGSTSGSGSAAASNDAFTTTNLTITGNNYETVNFISQGANNTVAVLNASDATALNVTGGDKTLTISSFSTSNLTSIDTSAFAKAFTMGASAGNKATTVTGGSAADTIITGTNNDTITTNGGNDDVTPGTGNDTVTTGDGADTVTGVGGDNTITLGAGDDSLEVATFSNLTVSDTVTGGDGTDTIDFQQDAAHNFTSSTTTLSGVSGFEKYKFSGLANKTVTIDSTLVTDGAATIEFTSGITTDNNALNASAILNSSDTITFNDNSDTSSNVGTNYTLSNAKDLATLGADADTATVSVSAYLGTTDVIKGGAGTDTLVFSSTSNSTISSAQLEAASGFEVVNVVTGGAGDYKVTISDTFAANNANSSDALTVGRDTGAAGADTGTTEIIASDVSSTYGLTLTVDDGQDSDDKITGGAGDDFIGGGQGTDTYTLTAGGADTIIFDNNGLSTQTKKIVGFTLRGTATAAATGADTLRFEADDVNSDSLLFDGNAIDNAGDVELQATDPTNAVNTVVALHADDYSEVAGGSAILDNHINVVTGSGYASLNKLLEATPQADDGGIDDYSTESAIVIFYNTSTQRAEMQHATSNTTVTNQNAGAVTATSTVLGYFEDIGLADMAGFDSTNFEVISLA
jgi:hypothetical protein